MRGLVQRLLEHDGARNVLAEPRGGVQKLPPVAAVLLRVLHANRVKALAGRGIGLVRGEDALPTSGNVLCGGAQLLLEGIRGCLGR